jgi:hypothetical protein
MQHPLAEKNDLLYTDDQICNSQIICWIICKWSVNHIGSMKQISTYPWIKQKKRWHFHNEKTVLVVKDIS